MTWQERLNGAVKGAGLNVTSLQSRLAEWGAKGSSYGSVWAYLNKADTAAPPMEFFEAAAHILEVRAAWLAFGEGERTEEEERARRWEEEELARQTVQASEHEVGFVFPRGALLHLEDLTARHALLDAWRTITGGSGPSETWHAIENAILAPLNSLELPVAEGDAFNDYAAAVALAIRSYARAARTSQEED